MAVRRSTIRNIPIRKAEIGDAVCIGQVDLNVHRTSELFAVNSRLNARGLAIAIP